LLGACETRSQVSEFDGRCWIRGTDHALVLLDAYVENIETCGARLEVRHIQTGVPVTGAFGGTPVFANSNAIEAGTPWGYRTRLVSAADRDRIDTAIRRMLDQQASPASAPL
jgi:hypothetical protein